MKSVLYFVFAAFLEIAGCFSSLAWLRQGGPTWTLFPGIVSLVLFALCLAQVDADLEGGEKAIAGGMPAGKALYLAYWSGRDRFTRE